MALIPVLDFIAFLADSLECDFKKVRYMILISFFNIKKRLR